MRPPLPRSKTSILLLPALGLLLAGCGDPETSRIPDSNLGAQSESASLMADKTEVTRLAHAFMEALSTRDTARLDELLAPHAALFSIREGEEGPAYGIRTREEFLGGLAQGDANFLERIWEPTVEVTGRIGMVWAPYDFHSDGVFSHCGVDVLAFLKMAEGWKVTSVTYNVVREGCPASPLGAPGG